MTDTCLQCGAEMPPQSVYADGRGRYCTTACRQKAYRKRKAEEAEDRRWLLPEIEEL
jgi:hypothetical protein